MHVLVVLLYYKSGNVFNYCIAVCTVVVLCVLYCCVYNSGIVCICPIVVYIMLVACVPVILLCIQ